MTDALPSRMRNAMMMLAAGAAACGTAAPRDDRSWAEHMDAARAHDRAAADEASLAAGAEEQVNRGYDFVCGDDVLNDQLTTGGLRVTTWVPCWAAGEGAAAHHRFAAERERGLAYAERHAAAQLDDAARLACEPISTREREHSPFTQRKQIVHVDRVDDHGRLRGVRVVLAKTPGLTGARLRDDIACHRALWRLHGSDPRDAPQDPTLVVGARVTIVDHAGAIDVIVTSDEPGAPEIALARARGQLEAEREAAGRAAPRL